MAVQFGQMLRKARGSRSQEELAREIGTTVSMLSKYENGWTVPGLDSGQFYKVCAVYGLKPSRVVSALAESVLNN